MSTEELPLIVGNVYRAKKPLICGFPDELYNDRQIVWIGSQEVQYDSPSVRIGRRLPRISKEKFLKWAARNVTAETPKGEWNEYKRV